MGEGFDDGARYALGTHFAPLDKLFQHRAEALQVGDSLLNKPKLEDGCVVGISACSGLLQSEEASDFFKGKAKCLSTLDESHARSRSRIVVAESAQLLGRFCNQPTPLVEPDSFNIDLARGGNLPDG